MNNLLRNRSAKFASRRQQDIQDQCQAYMTSRYLIVMIFNASWHKLLINLLVPHGFFVCVFFPHGYISSPSKYV
jgi:hypothetical protein